MSATYIGRDAFGAEPPPPRRKPQARNRSNGRKIASKTSASVKPPRRVQRRRKSGDLGTPPPPGARAVRLNAILIVLGVVALVLGYRLADLQLAEGSTASSPGSAAIPAADHTRGTIYDDKNNPLALDDDVYYIDAAPNQIVRPKLTARILAPFLNVRPASLVPVLSTSRLYARLGGPVDYKHMDKITRALTIHGLRLPGITLDPTPRRVYPEGRLAAQVLGFDNTNGGQYGLEEEYNGLLQGTVPVSRLYRMAHTEGDPIHTDHASQANEALGQGATLKTCIDTYVQDTVQSDLSAAVKSSGGVGGMAIVMDPKNGCILAMAGYPSFNPNDPSASPPSSWSNPAITYTYEPGSTFKVLTMSAGIDTGVVTPQTTIYDPGWASFLGGELVVHNWNCPDIGTSDCVSNGEENMIQVFQHSANVGAAHVAGLLGSRLFYKYITRFGVGQKTGIDLQGEAPGYLPLPGVKHSPWSSSNLYTNAYGQAVTLTPLQLITAVNAVANNGCMMKPRVVTRISYRDVTLIRKPHRIGCVMSAKSAHTVTNMLVKSAKDGEAENALIPGYRIAAKTGTASMANPNGPGYLSGVGSTIASTVAYAPANHPRFSVLVVIRQPKTYPWGSVVAAPVVQQIFQSLFLRFHIQPH